MMGFFCCTHSHFSNLTGWMCHGYGSHISGQDRFRGKTKGIYLFHFFSLLKVGLKCFFQYGTFFLTQIEDLIEDVVRYTACKAH